MVLKQNDMLLLLLLLSDLVQWQIPHQPTAALVGPTRSPDLATDGPTRIINRTALARLCGLNSVELKRRPSVRPSVHFACVRVEALALITSCSDRPAPTPTEMGLHWQRTDALG